MKRKRILLAIIILLIILVICIIAILAILREQKQKSIPYEEEGTIEIEINSQIEKVSNRNNYYIAKSCVTKFYTYYAAIYDSENEKNVLDEETSSVENIKKQNAEVIYDLLDQEYIKDKQITKENILTKLSKINTSIININNMYVSQKTENISVYMVEGTLREKVSGKITDFQIMLQLDSKNRTFTVFLEDYIKEKYKGGFKIGNELDIKIQNSIEENENNVYDYISVTEETYVTDLFNKYKEEVLYNPSLAYEHLNEEYKNKRYGTIEKFKEYAKNNIRKNVIAKITKYQKTVTDNYTQYVCIDQNENYYIFRENAVMDYTLILDTYTIELPEFTQKYNNAEEKEKILLNIQKIFEAINSGDYQYVYNKLDNTFKANYFKTLEQFEKYIKTNWYNDNKASYGSYQKNGDTYVYNIQITNKENTSAEKIDKKIVMQLKEGTDFVMSFNVQ